MTMFVWLVCIFAFQASRLNDDAAGVVIDNDVAGVVVDDDVCLVDLMPAWHFSHHGVPQANRLSVASVVHSMQHSIVSVVHSWTLFYNDCDDLAEEVNNDDDNDDDDDDGDDDGDGDDEG